MKEDNKNFKKRIRDLNIKESAKKELYNLLKYVDLTIENDFSIKNYHVVVNDYTEIHLEKVVNLVEEIFATKLDDVYINVKYASNLSSFYASSNEIFIVKSVKENFSSVDEKYKDFYWMIDLNTENLEEMKQEILLNIVNTNGFVLENSNILEVLAKQELKVAKKAIMLACSEAHKLGSQNVKMQYFGDLMDGANQKSSLSEISDLIGLESVKQTLNEMINYLKLQKFKNKIPMLHMAFLGNPGTGKTTVARAFGKILSGLKILSNEEIFVEVTRTDLVGKHIGETEDKTMKMIEKATGGILFIDEAYSLYSDKYSRDFGHNVIDILIREMENRKDRLCVIFAGYTREIKEFIEMNAGLKSRINFMIDFEDYTNEELFEIFEKYMREDELFLNERCKKQLLEYFSNIKNIKNFGNGREIRNIAEQLKIIQANRMMKKNNFGNVNEIVLEDVKILIDRNKNKYKIEEKRVIGFL